jgi:hypothetical protein
MVIHRALTRGVSSRYALKASKTPACDYFSDTDALDLTGQSRHHHYSLFAHVVARAALMCFRTGTRIHCPASSSNPERL